jgi:hypothetical protein
MGKIEDDFWRCTNCLEKECKDAEKMMDARLLEKGAASGSVRNAPGPITSRTSKTSKMTELPSHRTYKHLLQTPI